MMEYSKAVLKRRMGTEFVNSHLISSKVAQG